MFRPQCGTQKKGNIQIVISKQPLGRLLQLSSILTSGKSANIGSFVLNFLSFFPKRLLTISNSMRVSILVTPFSQEISTSNDHLVVEKTNALLNEGDAELLSSLKDRCIILASSWCSDVFGTRSSGTVDVIDEGKLDMSAHTLRAIHHTYEGIAGNSNFTKLSEPFLAFFFSEFLWYYLEEGFITLSLWTILGKLAAN